MMNGLLTLRYTSLPLQYRPCSTAHLQSAKDDRYHKPVESLYSVNIDNNKKFLMYRGNHSKNM